MNWARAIGTDVDHDAVDAITGAASADESPRFTVGVMLDESAFTSPAAQIQRAAGNLQHLAATGLRRRPESNSRRVHNGGAANQQFRIRSRKSSAAD